MTSAGDGETPDLPASDRELYGFTLQRPEDGPRSCNATDLPLTVAALIWRRGDDSRARRRRGPESLRAAGGALARNSPGTACPVTGGTWAAPGQRIRRAALPECGGPNRARRAVGAPLK